MAVIVATDHSKCSKHRWLHLTLDWSRGQHLPTVSDAAIVLRGPDIYTLIEWGQEAISKILNFGHDNGLEFRADKMEVVIFTRKRLNTLGLRRLCMANRDLSYSDTVKYLGVLLDSKLTFGSHIREKVKKATRLLYCFKTSVGQLWGPSLYLMRWVLTGIVLPKITYGAMVWANKAANYKKHLDRVQRLGLLAMAHVCHSTPTAGLEVILGVMPLDLHTQCVAAWVAYRVQGQSTRDGIGRSCLRGHLFWSNQLLKQVDTGDCTNSNKRAIQDLFHNRWRECWKYLTTCHQTKYWIDDPGSTGNATACLDHLTLSIVLQALTGHNYLNYHHHIAGNISEQNCRFCREGHEEFIHLACRKCEALTTEHLGSVWGLWLSRNPPDLYSLVRLTKVNHIGKALERRAE